jgi:hypothetical protein
MKRKDDDERDKRVRIWNQIIADYGRTILLTTSVFSVEE